MKNSGHFREAVVYITAQKGIVHGGVQAAQRTGKLISEFLIFALQMSLLFVLRILHF